MSKKTIQALNKLNKLKKFELDEKRQALVDLQSRLRLLHGEVKNLHNQQLLEIESARDEPMTRVNLPTYLEGLRKAETRLKQKIYQLADFMIPVEESVRESFKEVKSLEIAVKTLHDRIRYQQERRDQYELDELSQHRKKAHTND